jgi:alpha-beta hydrolase superfamily lysophospholipase
MTETDVLGAPYTRETLTLPDDEEGPVVATVVRRPAEGTARGAVLHVHGFCDYFFGTGQAEFWADRGYDFYAVDLRKYGRSLLPHQTPNFCRDLTEYDADLDAALDLVTRRDGHRTVVISAHSTGGLIAALWAHRRHAEGRRVADAFVMNSPWLDLQGSLFNRTIGTEAINRLGVRRPYAVVPRTVSGVYVEAIHSDFHGEWDFDLTWKPRESFTVHAGWLRAIRIGHRTVHKGVDVGAPVLTLCSAASTTPEEFGEEATSTDTVLDVRQIAKWSHQLGHHVTLTRVRGAMHDVFLSRKDVRDDAFGIVDRWLGYAL